MKEFIYKAGPCEYGKSKGIYGVVVVEGGVRRKQNQETGGGGQGGKDLPRNFLKLVNCESLQ